MEFSTYKVYVGNTYYIVVFRTDDIEKIFDYYKVKYEKLER